MKIKNIVIFLVLLCCIIGTASAAEDVSTDVVSDTVDDVAVDAVQEEISDSSSIDETEPSVSEDTTIEKINEEIQTDEISEESAIRDSELRFTEVDAADWATLKGYGETVGTDYEIHLTNPITVAKNSYIIFKNSATIVGTPDNYITGGSSSKTIFQSTGSLDISFINVTFKNMDASVLIKLATTGNNNFINCSFDNIHTYAYKSSVIWNDKGFMNISGCNFTNCNDGFGAITNYATTGTVQMNVENCRFENNTGRMEPGAINNCGELNVTNCTFIHNVANWWAGAIHTHTFANTRIVDSNFADNVAGWNGGALFSYSTLEVINCNFEDNNCSTNTGGGAICGYSYQGSIYNITVDSCNFTHNLNLNSNGRGGAIGVQNIGYLTVFNSIFKNDNNATNGTAISAICENITYCINCTNCSCPNCPNCTNCTHNVSTGDPDCKIYNNTYLNHGGPGDTVVISGNDFVFYDNIFRNSVQTVYYNESGNQYGLTSSFLNSPQYTSLKSISSSSVLSLDYTDIIYVNASSSNDWSSVDGQSWENAIGGVMGPYWAATYINDNGIIYLADTIYPQFNVANQFKNFTIIGKSRENTLVNIFSIGNAEDPEHYSTTFINITFIGSENDDVLGNDLTFINCTFINFKTIKPINEDIDENVEYGVEPPEESFITNFIDCDFINSTLTGENLIDIDKYTQINFNNCNFENITADSIVNSVKGKFHTQDSINFNNCKFTNVVTKGIVSMPTGNEIRELVHIEDCTFDVPVTTEVVTEGGNDYINSTDSRVGTVLSAEVDADDNLVITLKDDNGNAVAGVQVLISVNGGDAAPFDLEDDGTLTKPLSDFASSTGPINIVVTFEKTNDYKGATQTVDYVIRTATSISAEDLTTEVNVAKDLTVTLLDNNNNPIAGKDIIVSVDGVNSTVQTDENGVAKIPISYASAGVHEYTLYFAGDDTTYKGSTKVVKVTVNKASEPATNDTNDTPVGPGKVATKLSAPKVTATYNVAKKLVITLKDKNGKALTNKKVTVKVGSISKTLTTNAKGQVSLNVATLVPKTYTATVKFAGDDGYSASSVSPKVVVSKAKPKLAAKAKTFKVKAKVKKFTATLKNNKGKVMKKAKLTLKIGKKTYKATTNSKGVATFKVKLTKKGKYTATVKFAGNKYYKALSKKVKITVKK